MILTPVGYELFLEFENTYNAFFSKKEHVPSIYNKILEFHRYPSD